MFLACGFCPRPIKSAPMNIRFLIFVAALLVTGCASTDRIMYDTTKRPPKQNVKLYPRGTAPEGKYLRIATLTFLGPPEDEAKAVRHFVKDAKKLGADGIVYLGLDMPQMKGGIFVGRGG